MIVTAFASARTRAVDGVKHCCGCRGDWLTTRDTVDTLEVTHLQFDDVTRSSFSSQSPDSELGYLGGCQFLRQVVA